MTQLEAIQKDQSLVNIRPKPTEQIITASMDMTDNKTPPIIIQNADGTQTQINQVASPPKADIPQITGETTMIIDEEGNLRPGE